MEYSVGSSEYLSVIRTRWWVVVLVALVGSGVAWITAPSQTDDVDTAGLFRATTVLVRGQSATGETAGAANLSLAALLAGSGVVIERSAAELGRPQQDLTSGFESSVVADVGSLHISSVDLDPAAAEAEADTIAAQLVAYLGERRQQQLEPLIASTAERIEFLRARLAELDAQIFGPGPQFDLQRAERDSVLRQLGSNLDREQQLKLQVAAASNELEVLSTAVAVPEPSDDGFAVPDSRVARAAIAFAIALVVGLALVLLTERINPRIRTVAQAEQAFGLPVIAEIPRRSRRLGARRTIETFSDPYSVAAESYRGMRTALWYIPRANGSHPEMHDRFVGGHVVLVTSATPGDGKTTVVANLAAAFAEKDGDVVVVSGDARQPEIEPLLLGRRAAGARLAATEQSDTVLTMIPGVKLVLSCDPDSNPADIVGHESQVARRERARSQIVIIDTPPALVANDASELMHTADSVVLVARCGSTDVAAARRVGELVARLRAPVVGVVLIGTPDASADSHYYRQRPSRRSTRRTRRAMAPVRERPMAPPPAPHVETPETVAPPMRPASTAPSAPVPSSVDDGGIWRRPTGTIDLSAAGDNLPARAGFVPAVVPPRATRTTVGEGYPSRDVLESNAPIPRSPDDEHAGSAGAAMPRLPLFRAGDGNGHGNGRSR